MRKNNLIFLSYILLLFPLSAYAEERKEQRETRFTINKDTLFYTATDSQNVRIEKTQNLVNAAISYYENHSQEEAMNLFNDRNSVFNQKYPHGYKGVNVMTKQGTFLASPMYPGFIGRNGLAWQSPDGVRTHLEILKAAEQHPEGGLTLPIIGNNNPITGKPSAHRFYVRVIDDLVFFSSVYEDAPLYKELNNPENIERYQNH